MNNYNFNGTGYVDLQNPTPDLNTILNYQNEISPNINREIPIIKDPVELSQELTARVQPELQRKITQLNKQFFTPSKDGIVINNHDRLYDYYKVGNNLYYKKKGDEGWIDISDNQLAQQRINNTLARNNAVRNTASVNNTPTEPVNKHKELINSLKSNKYLINDNNYINNINNIGKNTIYKPQVFTPTKITPKQSQKPKGKRLEKPKSRPYSYIGGYKYYIYTDSKGNWIK